MSLEPGIRVGVYEVISLLGVGGMGEVYRARDSRLQRDVALKILPDHFASDPDRLARFEREAQVLATLAHPNIGHIYGLEHADSAPVLVLELIEGPTLADRIAQGPISVAEAIAIATQIAGALDAAHERGIIHRDLKPGNVKVAGDGTVKVLDFGLAKLTQPAGSGLQGAELTMSPTMSAALTGAGVILGTAAYMSPEQACGRAVDKRADIWALGCVLFEMLSGKGAFTGTDATEVIAAVVRAEPEWAALPSGTPPKLIALLKRCVQKDPKQRLRDIGDLRFELDEILRALATPEPSPAEAGRYVAIRTPLWRRAVPVAIAVLATTLIVGAVAFTLRTEPGAGPLARFAIALADGEQFSNTGRHAVAISPLGTHIAYNAKWTYQFARARPTRADADWRHRRRCDRRYIQPESVFLAGRSMDRVLAKRSVEESVSHGQCAGRALRGGHPMGSQLGRRRHDPVRPGTEGDHARVRNGRNAGARHNTGDR